MCKLSEFTEPQLRLIQHGIAQQIVDNNHHIQQLELVYEFTELSKHDVYLERKQRKEDLNQCATKILEELVHKRTEAIVTCN